MRVPKVPSQQEKREIQELLEYAIARPIEAEEMQSMRSNSPDLFAEFIEANTVTVMGVRVCVLFEVHSGDLFQRVRLVSGDSAQPSYEVCMDLLPHLGMERDMRKWAASWAEIVDGDEESPPRMAYNISQVVIPPGITIN